VVFLSDGGDSVRNLQAYLHPNSEHWLDRFHITMRISVLQQQEQPEELEAVLRPQDVADSTHYLAHVGGARPTTSFAAGMSDALRGCLKSPANAKFTERGTGFMPALRKLKCTYSTEFDGSQDFSNTL
jgi:hypothetical protein